MSRPRTLGLMFAGLYAAVASHSALAYQISGVQVEPLAKSHTSWNGTPLPAYRTGQPEVTILKYRIEPGAELPPHLHPVINAGVVLKGELTVVSDTGERLHLKAGDAIIELVDQVHQGRNEGNEPVELIVFYAGNVGQPTRVLKED
ncbi:MULTISPECIES: cupin domain-containing protein [unclassified Thiocapsa]|uniref:cupin domain-containing protein n=1 Tax=unclassified Thiocapsa TaxID=2641286 RepID=UPI0035B107AA